MRTAYLVGNGFDLSVGLATKPNDFLAAFVEENSGSGVLEGQSPASKMANDIGEEGVEQWSDFELKLGEYSDRFKEDGAEDYVRSVSSFIDYLGRWLECEQGRVDPNFIKANATECINSLNSFRMRLRDLNGRQLASLRMKHKADHWYQDIICFNYTDVLERMWRSVGGSGATLGSLEGNTRSILGKFVYAHDSLKDKIVCGVNDSSQIKNVAFRSNRQVIDNLVKGRIEAKVLAKNLDEQARVIIDDANIVAVFGMSFGQTDRRWWEQVGKKLDEDQDALLLLFDHEMIDAEKGASPFLLYSRRQNRIDTFARASGLEITEELESRIIVAPSNLLFPIKQPLIPFEVHR